MKHLDILHELSIAFDTRLKIALYSLTLIISDHLSMKIYPNKYFFTAQRNMLSQVVLLSVCLFVCPSVCLPICDDDV